MHAAEFAVAMVAVGVAAMYFAPKVKAFLKKERASVVAKAKDEAGKL